jgi:hypothetical protein
VLLMAVKQKKKKITHTFFFFAIFEGSLTKTFTPNVANGIEKSIAYCKNKVRGCIKRNDVSQLRHAESDFSLASYDGQLGLDLSSSPPSASHSASTASLASISEEDEVRAGVDGPKRRRRSNEKWV